MRTTMIWRGIVLAASLAGGLLAACGSVDGGATEDVGVQQEALVTKILFALPRGATPENTVLGAVGEFLHVNDGAQIVSDSPVLPGIRVLPVIASNSLAQVGVNAWGGAVIARGNVWLRGGRAGSVTTAGQLEQQAGSSPGYLELGASLNPAELHSYTLDLPTVNQGPRTMVLRGLSALDPAMYDAVTVKSQGTLSLRAGTYSLGALIMEPDSVLRIDNSAGPVMIHIRSEFLYRGGIVETVPSSPNVLFAYVGSTPVHIERAFRGTLVAPNADVLINGTATTHLGAIFGRRVELHQRHTFRHRPLRLGAAPVCEVTNFTQVTDFPFDRSRNIDNDHQGVTHSADTWYFANAHSTVCTSCLPPLIGPFCPRACTNSSMWSFPLGQDVGAGTPPKHIGNPWAGRYNHFGDITFVPGAGSGDGFIFVALEAGTGGIATRGGIGVFTQDLNFHRGFGVTPAAVPAAADQGGSMPWVTFNEFDGFVYSASFNDTWLNAYQVALRPAIDASGVGADVTWKKSLRLRDCATNAPVTVERMQGSDVSPSGKLYVAIDVQGGGVIIIDPNSGKILDFVPVNFDRNGEDEELEGVSIWDRENTADPGIRGHLHVSMIQNDSNSNDNFYFKHLRADDPSKL
jgi:hypothetical protein